MNDRTKNAIECQRAVLAHHIEEVRDSRYFRGDVNDLEKHLEMLENVTDYDEPTAITYADLMDAYIEMGHARTAYDDVNEPYEHCRYGISGLRDYITRGERLHYDADKIAQAKDELKQLNEEYDANYLGDEFTLKLCELNERKCVTSLTFRTLCNVHVKQCAEVAIKALSEDLSWTKQPTRYKRMRTKAEAIANAALFGTGCKVTVYESGEIHINHSGETFFTHYEHGDNCEIFKGRDELPNIEAMRNNSPKFTTDTYETVSHTVENIYEAKRRIIALHDEYTKSVREILAPFDRLGIDDNTECVYPSLNNCALVKYM